MSKNIIYSIFQAPPGEDDDEEFLIDSNELMDERMKVVEAEYEKKRILEERKKRTRIEERPVLDEEGKQVLDEEGNPLMEEVEVYDEADSEENDENGFSEGIEEFAQNETEEAAIPENIKERADEILSDASSQAESIINSAREEAEQIKNEAYEEGKSLGFSEGKKEAEEQLSEERKNLSDMEESLKNDFLKQEEELEKNLVNTICDVFERVFKKSFSDDKEILFHLVDNALNHIEGSRQLLIKSNEENTEFLKEKKDYLMEKVGSDVTLDIISDPLLKQDECLIETDGGIFDCGIDTELSNLIKKIRELTS